MPIDNQLWQESIIYNSNQLHQVTNLKANLANLDICFILKFSVFYMITFSLILLTYFSIYLILTPVRNYDFSINKFKIANVLLINHFNFCCYDFNLKRMFLLESGNIETNPGPRRCSFIKFCHYNLKGLTAHAVHDFGKMSLIEAFITTHNFDIICLSETFLD